MTTNPTEAAAEAGARAILAGADIGSFYASGDWDAAGADVQMSMYKASAVALTAALPHLHPTIPNPVDGLDALPEGAVIRGELLPGVAIVCEKWADRWLVTGEPESYDSRDLARVWQDIATWTVLWPLGGAA